MDFAFIKNFKVQNAIWNIYIKKIQSIAFSIRYIKQFSTCISFFNLLRWNELQYFLSFKYIEI